MQLCRKTEAITRAFILGKISDYDIYRYYFDGNFKINRPTINTLRGEHQASFTIFQGIDGKLHHHDQADDYWKGDCFNLVCQKYGITLYEALCKIAKDFFLVDGPPDAYKAITSQYVKPVVDTKQYAKIQCVVKKFTQHELKDYWGRYPVIGEQKLKKHNVWSLKEVFLNRKSLPIGKHEMVFGYQYGDRWKIMFPERDKTKKWLSNVPLDTPGGLENLNKDHNSLVIKSLKCYMVMEEVYEYLCYMQNESLGSVSDTTGAYVTENSKKVYYGGDSDPAGKKASYRITEKHNWYHINVPDKYLPLKDWSDLSTIENGMKLIEEHLKIKGIIV